MKLINYEKISFSLSKEQKKVDQIMREKKKSESTFARWNSIFAMRHHWGWSLKKRMKI